ncbi:hypothetical protein F4803DRAFT_526340 [Xylaria telfairii]|nr:hypothetical protein F4803DRAFT_526340 [Xylaria telfairii]
MTRQMSKLRHAIPFLFKRDVCSDALGADRSNDFCSPSNTLCCLQSGEDFPSCQVHMDIGWCCIGNSSTDNCYVDQPSVCGTPNSVPCTHLAEGVSEACCPPLTSCTDGYNATETNIRCQISYSSLILLDVQSTTSSPTSMSTTSTSTSTSLTPSTSSTRAPTQTTSSAADALPTQLKSGQSLSPGGIAGIVVGTVAGIVIAGVIAYYFLRRRWVAKYGNPNEPSSALDKAPTVPDGNTDAMHPWHYIESQEPTVERQGGNTRYELSAVVARG